MYGLNISLPLIKVIVIKLIMIIEVKVNNEPILFSLYLSLLSFRDK